MTNIVKKLLITGASVATIAHANMASAAINFGGAKVNGKIKGSEATADTAIQVLVGNIMIFIGIIAVLYAIYGGFRILTAGGKDEGVKAGKTILIQATIGIIVIFLANSIIQWVLKLVTST